MIGFGLAFALLWASVILVAHDFPSAAGSIVSGGIGASITLAIFVANRLQGRRQSTLELYKEFYSADFAAMRVLAREFMIRHRDVDWSLNDPYDVGGEDGALKGYSAVVRFFHRFAVLYEENEINRDLARRLLSREAGYWSKMLFAPMCNRSSMYTLRTISNLLESLSKGSPESKYTDGEADAANLIRRQATN